MRCELAGVPLLHDEVRIEAAPSPIDLDSAGAYGSLALLGMTTDSTDDPEELRLAGPGKVLRALAPEAATLQSRLGAAQDAWLGKLYARG